MKDIDIARDILLKEDLSIVLVKDGKIVYKSKDRGIRPIYNVASELKDLACNASIADRVIGSGAARLMAYIGAREVYTDLISQSAIDLLNKAHIPFTYKVKCISIYNRDKTDLCPVEKISNSSYNIEELLNKIEGFLS